MNKKIIASVCGAAVLATAVYFGGVYVNEGRWLIIWICRCLGVSR